MKLDEKGFTIIELSMVVSVVALITLGASVTTSQIIDYSLYSTDLTTALHQARNAGYWVSQDVLMAQGIDVGDDPATGDEEFAVINWKDWENGDIHTISYLWFDSDDSLQQLKRKLLTLDRYGTVITSETTLVAGNICAANLTAQDSLWTFFIKTRANDEIVTKEYEIRER